MTVSLFSGEEERRVAEAIAAIEKKTCGEIVAVVAADSARYNYVPFLWAGLVALLVPWPFVYLTWWSLPAIYIVQLLVFLALVAILFYRPLRLALVPAGLKRENAHRRAVEQFLAQNLVTTEGRTGVLIFVSVAERYAEIIPDTGIAAKVPASIWQEIVDRLTADIGSDRAAAGFLKAIDEVGRHLAQHFPPAPHNANQLPNHLIVLR
jgi:putative membrane protein